MADGPGPSNERQPNLGEVLRKLRDAREKAHLVSGEGNATPPDVQLQIAELVTRQFGTAHISNGLLEVAKRLPELVEERARSVVRPREMKLKDGSLVRISDSRIITERTFAPIAPRLTRVVKRRVGFGTKFQTETPVLDEAVERALIQMTPGHAFLEEAIGGQREIRMQSSRVPASLEWVFRLMHLDPHEVKALGPTPAEEALRREQEIYGDGHTHGMVTQEGLEREAARRAAEEKEQREAHLAEVARARTEGEKAGAEATTADHDRITEAAKKLIALGAQQGVPANGAVVLNGTGKHN